ncbi:MAG: methyltransferase domain-containing protein [Porticoccaceae bacterium]|nr:methyltransferase domain-containing protein [Porticoccaceae bacterium]
MTQTFKEMELAGWNEKASAYDLYAGKITPQAVEPLLDAIAVEPGMQVLDVATGPGYLAGGAHQRGAIATGIDFSGSMVAQAQRNFPDALFYEGDAESLIFPNDFFDAIACPFGLLHLSAPEKAVANAFRVLRPGGKYGFTVWAPPERHAFFNIVLGAIGAHGSNDVALPEAPPFFRFSDPGECKNILEANGFRDATVSEISLNWKPEAPNDLLDMIYKSSVRTAKLFELQTGAARDNIHQHILEQAAKVIDAGDELPWAAVMAVGTKPERDSV